MRRAIVLLLFVLALLVGIPASAAVAPSGPPTSTGTGGAAASVETLATQAAIDTLKAGGNAIDAAVAAAGVLGVTEPFSCGLGGGGFMVIRPAHGKVITIDGRETAPEATTSDVVHRPRDRPAAGVQRRALERAVRRRPRHARDVGRRAEEVRDDEAQGRAEAGHQRRARTASSSTRRSSTRRRARSTGSTTFPTTAALYLDPDGTPHDVGTTFRNPDLAHTYELIAKHGVKELYHGQDRARDRRHRAAPESRADGEPRLAARRDDAERPEGLPRAEAQADARQVPRARRVLDGAAVERRLDRGRGAEHPRGLQPRVDVARRSRSTTSSRRRATRSPTATRTSPTPTTTTCR